MTGDRHGALHRVEARRPQAQSRNLAPADGSRLRERHRARIRDRGRGEPQAQRHARRLSVPQVRAVRLSTPTASPSRSSNIELLQAVWKRWTESPEGYNTAGYQSFARRRRFRGASSKPACGSGWNGAACVGEGPGLGPRDSRARRSAGSPRSKPRTRAVFFGREAAIARATTKLRRSPFLLLIGASGSGKSSLLRAGLVPRVTAPGVIRRRRPLAHVRSSAPGGDPLLRARRGAVRGRRARTPNCAQATSRTPHLLARLLQPAGKAAHRADPQRARPRRRSARRRVALRRAASGKAPHRGRSGGAAVRRGRAGAGRGFRRACCALWSRRASPASSRCCAAIPMAASRRSSRSWRCSRTHGATLDLLPPTAAELEDIVTRPVAACHPPLAYETDAAGPLARRGAGRRCAGRRRAAAPADDAAAPRIEAEAQRAATACCVFADYPGMGAAVTRTARGSDRQLDARRSAALPALITAFVRDVNIAPRRRRRVAHHRPGRRDAFERGDRRAHGAARRVRCAPPAHCRGGQTAWSACGPVHEALLRVVPEAVAHHQGERGADPGARHARSDGGGMVARSREAKRRTSSRPRRP